MGAQGRLKGEGEARILKQNETPKTVKVHLDCKNEILLTVVYKQNIISDIISDSSAVWEVQDQGASIVRF